MRASPATLHALQHQLDVLEAAIGGVYDDRATPPVETFADKFKPRGGDELVPVPDEVEVDPSDVGEAWDSVF